MRRIFILLIIGVLAVIAAFVAIGSPGGPATGAVVPEPVHAEPAPSPTSGTAPVITTLTTTLVTPGPARVIAAPENSTPVTVPATTTVRVTSPAPHGTVATPVSSATPPFPLPAGPAQGDPYTISTTGLAEEIHTLVNRQRAANGLNALGTDTALANLALNHSADMAAGHYFAHKNPAGQDPTARGETAGYLCKKDYGSYYTYGIAENIYQNNRYSTVTYYSDGRYTYEWNAPETIAQSTVDGWMKSPGHRKNILAATCDREGIGIAISDDDKIYITEDFC